MKQKGRHFEMNGITQKYINTEPIFYLVGPIDATQNQAIKKCPSCHYVFGSRSEMHYCTFCGLSNDEKCMKKTYPYPEAMRDHTTGMKQRGPICKLCRHKFFVHERVSEVVKTINGTKVSI